MELAVALVLAPLLWIVIHGHHANREQVHSLMAGHNRSALIAELAQVRTELRVSERKSKRAVRIMRDLEKVLDKAIPRMRTWVSLPVQPETLARGVLTTAECTQLLALLDGSKKPDTPADQADEPVAADD